MRLPYIYSTFSPEIGIRIVDGDVKSILSWMKYTNLFNQEKQFALLGKPDKIKYNYKYSSYWLYLNYPEKYTSILLHGYLKQVVNQGKIEKDDLCISEGDDRATISVYLYSPSVPEFDYEGFSGGSTVDLHKELKIGFDELIEMLNHPNPCISVLGVD